MLLKTDINKQIVDTVSLIHVILELGYIPNSRKYAKLNNAIICKTLNDYSNVLGKTFNNNLIHYYNLK